MKTLYEVRKALQDVSLMFNNDWQIPVKVDGREIECITLTNENEVEIKTIQNKL